MLVPVTLQTWRVLRATLRAAPSHPAGRELRLAPTFVTRDGKFLAEIVERGLLRVVTPDPDPFAATYALTPPGEHAAEYGEYDMVMPQASQKPGRKRGGKG